MCDFKIKLINLSGQIALNMYDCSSPICFQDCNSCCNGCINTQCTCGCCQTAEFPKCCGLYIEEKFSKMTPNMFLSTPSESKGKTKGTSCKCKKENKTKKCVQRAKDCKCSNDEETDYENGNNCPGAMPNMGMVPGTFGFCPNNQAMNVCTPCNIVDDFDTNPTLGVENGNNQQVWCGDYDPFNQFPQQQVDRPAAGTRSEQCPRFDPCTGQDCPDPTQRQLPGMHVLREDTRTSNLESCPKRFPQAMESNKKFTPNYQLINCNNVSPELIERLCNPQTGKPDNCYILLPVTMSTNSSKMSESRKSNNSFSNTKKAKSASSIPKKIADSGVARSQRPSIRSASGSPVSGGPTDMSRAERNTRNCGCNTVISGSAEETKNDGNQIPPRNCCSPVCQSSCCYYPCSCSCYYNPYLGCYCWYKNCCYGCNGCNSCNACIGCNNYCNSCCNSCPMPAKSTNTNGNSKSKSAESPSKENSPGGKQKSKKASPESGSDQRIMAGAVTPFEPSVPEMYAQWIESQHFANRVPKTAPTRPPSPMNSSAHYPAQPGIFCNPFYHQQMQMSNNHSKSPSSDQTAQKSEAMDIDWTPH